MIRFECDYGEGAAAPVLDALCRTNLEQTPGYGEDTYCEQARARIRCATHRTPRSSFWWVPPRPTLP